MEEIEHQLREVEGATSYLAAFESVLPQRLDLSNTLPTTEHIPALVMEMERYLQILHGRHRRGQVSEEQIKNVSLLKGNLIPLYQHVLHGAAQDILCEVRSCELDPLDAKDQGKQLRDAMRRLKALDRLVDGMLPRRYSPPDEK